MIDDWLIELYGTQKNCVPYKSKLKQIKKGFEYFTQYKSKSDIRECLDAGGPMYVPVRPWCRYSTCLVHSLTLLFAAPLRENSRGWTTHSSRGIALHYYVMDTTQTCLLYTRGDNVIFKPYSLQQWHWALGQSLSKCWRSVVVLPVAIGVGLKEAYMAYLPNKRFKDEQNYEASRGLLGRP